MNSSRIFQLAGMILLVMVCGSVLVGSGVVPAAYNLIENGGVSVTRRPTINFVDGGCVDNSGSNRTDCTFGGSGSNYQTIQVAGTPLAQEPVLNFPANMSCVDNPGNTSTDCTPSGGGGGCTATLTGWSLVNVSSPAANFNNFICPPTFSQTGTSSVQFQFATQTIPGATYTVIAAMNIIPPNQWINSVAQGLFLYDGTKIEDMELLTQGTVPGLQVAVRTSPGVSTGGSIISGPSIGITATQVTFKVQDNGTNRIWSTYNNGAFHTFLSEASGSFLTPTAVGFGGLCEDEQNSHCSVQLLSWTATTP
jgi:hypothetical protein